MLSNLAAQQQPVKSIHELTMNDIQTFMAEQFDPKRFVVRERFKFWSDMKRKPGETITELASRIRQDAATCDFQKKNACFRCGNSGHFSKACPHIKAICSFCKKTGHLQSVCISPMFCFTHLSNY